MHLLQLSAELLDRFGLLFNSLSFRFELSIGFFLYFGEAFEEFLLFQLPFIVALLFEIVCVEQLLAQLCECLLEPSEFCLEARDVILFSIAVLLSSLLTLLKFLILDV